MQGAKREKAARIVVDSLALGVEQAAKLHKVSPRTVKRYREAAGVDPDKAATDADLARLVAEKKRKQDAEWASVAIDFLRTSITKLKQLVQKAKPDQIREVAGAIKIVGDLQVVREAIGAEPEEDGELPGTAGSGTPPAEDPEDFFEPPQGGNGSGNGHLPVTH